ncbi:apolipoprotein N-acyltransferase [Marinivivus vitaminiproducens]|uniref:apolipoprotein N-acyltransferase n=1 Tax=Marinivivus vitaminiproducens TaxID=3035935 RepID=UPI0027A9210A|nr:apolipoprotein N-acyltransferase [Geminicoccaceae bacterium SCSIO 64248]
MTLALASEPAVRPASLPAWLRARPIAACILLGALAALALPPLHVLPGLLALAPFLALLRAAPTGRAALGRALAFGYGFHLPGIYWVGIAFTADAERVGVFAVPAVLALALIMAAFVAVAAAIVWRLRLRSTAAAVLALALAWTLAEVARDVLTDFPWNPIGSVWALSTLTLQPAALIGVYGMSALTVTLFALPATWLDDRGRIWPSLAGFGALALLLAWSGLRLAGAGDAVQPDVRLRLVQGDIAQHHKWDPNLRAQWFQRHLDLSMTNAERAPTAVIWPESATPYQLESDQGARAMIAQVAPEGGMVLTGGDRFDFDSEPVKGWNSLFAIDGRGDVAGRYDKVDLVPFGEFVPFRPVMSLIGLGAVASGMLDFQRGPGRVTMHLDGLPPFSPLICYEAAFTARVIDDADRPQWLLNVTNDAWFGTSSGPYQHFAMTRFRAVEEGLPLVRAANTGISAVIDGYGRVRASLGLNEMGVVDADLPQPLADPPPYARFGALLPMGLAALLALAALVLERRSRR